jgi:hypothetical protein
VKDFEYGAMKSPLDANNKKTSEGVAGGLKGIWQSQSP